MRVQCGTRSKGDFGYALRSGHLEVGGEDEHGLAVLLGDEVGVDAVEPAPPPVPQHRVVPDGAPAAAARGGRSTGRGLRLQKREGGH